MEDVELHLEPNEASDLCPVFNADWLRRRGWDRAFATVLDEQPAEQAIAVLGHDARSELGEGWTAVRIAGDATTGAGKTTDAEACARRDGTLFVVGSQFGSKSGPLDARRSFLARVPEEALAGALDGSRVDVEVLRLRFALHRAINDALAAAAVELIALGPLTRQRYIDATIAAGAKGEKRWAGRVTSADHPINVEGADFRGDGRLLLGLRYPVSADGHPLLVELDDIAAMFADPDTIPNCRSVWMLEDVGDTTVPMGVRALQARGADRFDAIVGDLDAAGKGATIIADHPEGLNAPSQHVEFELPLAAAGGSLTTKTIVRFGDERRVEGVASAGNGDRHYVIDEKGRVTLRAVAAA
jgi:hypothetical protein